MKITDEQFIAAMEQAVQEKGGTHQSIPAYSIYGVPECIIGYALSVIDSRLCPADNEETAYGLLKRLGCSHRVAVAGMVAQMLNDRRLAWKYVLSGFHWAMTQECRVAADLYIEAFTRAMTEWGKDRLISGVKPYPVSLTTTFANGGYTTPGLTLAPAWFTGGIPSSTITATTLGVTLNKKDHALTA